MSVWWVFIFFVATCVCLPLLPRLSPRWGGLLAMGGMFLILVSAMLLDEVVPSTQRASKTTAVLLGLIAFIGIFWVWCAFVQEWRHMTDKIRRLEDRVTELTSQRDQGEEEAS